MEEMYEIPTVVVSSVNSIVVSSTNKSNDELRTVSATFSGTFCDDHINRNRMTSSNRKGSADKTIPHTRLEDEEFIWESYSKGKKLGQGAFGKVYQVLHKSTSEEWAMKFINKDKAGGSAIKLLEREVAILKRVVHPNIIALNEVFETGKRMYLVMELCAEGELADYLKDRKYFMESEVKLITKELSSAIAYLHKIDIVHRDLKLENILVSKFPDATDPEDRLQIKITDFGLSITKSGVGHDNMMQDFCGTPNYMAPEIIDNKTYSQQCDVWALGVIVYTLFCGVPPFRSKDEDTLYDLIKKGDIDFTDEKWIEVSDEAKSCIQGMLNKDPAHRFTASEILDHHWITGDAARQQINVLTLMREWKEEIKNETEDNKNNGTPTSEDNSAINGVLGESSSSDVPDSLKLPSSSPVVSELSATSEMNNNDSPSTTTASSTDTERQTPITARKPNSGGKSSSRHHASTPGRLSVAGTARSSTTVKNNVGGTKSPMPNPRISNSRPSTQNAARNITSSSNLTSRPSQTNASKTSLSSRPTTKGHATRK